MLTSSLVKPHTKCRLRLLKLERIKDFLLIEEEFIQNQDRLRPKEERAQVGLLILSETLICCLFLWVLLTLLPNSLFRAHLFPDQEERTKVDDIRGSPMAVGSLEEIVDDTHAIVSTGAGQLDSLFFPLPFCLISCIILR